MLMGTPPKPRVVKDANCTFCYRCDLLARVCEAVPGRAYNVVRVWLNAPDESQEKTGNPWVRYPFYGQWRLLDERTREPELEINYSKPTEHIYISAALHLIKLSNSLQILNNIVCTTDSPTLPTWVPDCRLKPRIRQRIQPSTTADPASPLSQNATNFRISSDSRRLYVPGVRIDTAGETGEPFDESLRMISSSNSARSRGHLPSWHTLANKSATLMDKGKTGRLQQGQRQLVGYPRNYHRVLLGTDDVAVLGTQTYDNDIKAFGVWFKEAHKSDAYLVHENDDTAPIKTSEEVSSPPITAGEIAKALVESGLDTSSAMVCMGRRMMLTTKGYIVLGPQGTDVGDEVCMIRGCSVPMMLRKVERPKSSISGQEDDTTTAIGNNYRAVVGPCYLQGFMSEIPSSTLNGGGAETPFVLV